VGQLLSGLQLTLADLLLDKETIFARLGKAPRFASDSRRIFPNLVRLSMNTASRQRLDVLVGTFRFKTRLKDSPMFVLERLFQFEACDGSGSTVKVFEDVRVCNRTYAEGHCFHHHNMYFVAVECTEPPHQPLIYAFRDPRTPNIRALSGVSIAPDLFGAQLPTCEIGLSVPSELGRYRDFGRGIQSRYRIQHIHPSRRMLGHHDILAGPPLLSLAPSEDSMNTGRIPTVSSTR
jgi:hypothetical protein